MKNLIKSITIVCLLVMVLCVIALWVSEQPPFQAGTLEENKSFQLGLALTMLLCGSIAIVSGAIWARLHHIDKVAYEQHCQDQLEREIDYHFESMGGEQ
jgi:amino acid transporter